MLIWTLRIGVLFVVGWFVHGSVRRALDDLSEHEWHVSPLWLVAAGAIYVLALVPMGWFWQRALAALGSPAPMLFALYAYFLGHLGKYVPGKAMSVILRVAVVRKWVPSMRIALIGTFLETLTMMAAGACLAALLAIFVVRLDMIVSLSAVGMAIATIVPTIPPVARRLAALGLNRADPSDAAATTSSAPTLTPAEIAARLPAINFRLLAKGWLAAAVCWFLQAISLWATLRAIGVDTLSPASDLPILLAAVSFAVVAGFVSQIPGGLGVRDGLLVRLLEPTCGTANALVATILLRLIWLVSELVACGILYIATRFARSNVV
jgi:uncharacterized membrane protein YbhN (UPF0104 family)